MKKILLITAVAGVIVASCAKDRTCTCTTTVQSITSNQAGYSTVIPLPTTKTDTYTKVKSSNVLVQQCKTRNVIQTSNYSTGSGTNTVYYVKTETDQIDCTLK